MSCSSGLQRELNRLQALRAQKAAKAPSSSSSLSTESSSTVTPPLAHGGSAHGSGEQLSRYASPNSTGSRFDPLVDNGGPCRRAEVRKAAASRQKTKAPIGTHGAGSPPVHPRSPASTSPSSPESCAPPGVTPITIPTHAPYKRLLAQPFSHILVCDFEATCESGSVSFPHEIIEFPVVAIDTTTLRVVAEFHRYVRPVRNPVLTRFCTELTGITQQVVDAADTLPVVVEQFSAWLRDTLYPLCRTWRESHAAVDDSGRAAAVISESPDTLEETCVTPPGESSEAAARARCVPVPSPSGAGYCAALSANLRSEQRHFTYDDRTQEASACVPEEKMVCFATDGPWDMRRFMHECGVLRDGIDFPPVCYRYVNVRHCFCEHFKSKQLKLTHMLKKLHMTFEGQRHSGIADTRNIARVLAELLARGYRVHHVSTIKYRHRGDAFLASNKLAQELLEEYGEDDDDNRGRRNAGRSGSHRGGLPRNQRRAPKKRTK